jgi:hypothetical protein
MSSLKRGRTERDGEGRGEREVRDIPSTSPFSFYEEAFEVVSEYILVAHLLPSFDPSKLSGISLSI